MNKPDWISEFDKKFGTDEGTAGCDGCSINERLRKEHKSFISSLLASQKQEWIERGQSIKYHNRVTGEKAAYNKAIDDYIAVIQELKK